MICNVCGQKFDALKLISHQLRMVARDFTGSEIGEWNVIFKPNMCPNCASRIMEVLNEVIGELSNEDGEGNSQAAGPL